MPHPGQDGLHLVLISVHGLIRGHDLELGRDPDTGGQTLYVVELARALSERDPELAAYLDAAWPGARRETLSGDASTRRFVRLIPARGPGPILYQ